MKINFDMLESQVKKSLNTTIGSVGISSNSLTYQQHHENKKQKTFNAPNSYKNTYNSQQSNINPIPSNSFKSFRNSPAPNINNSHRHHILAPKKFSNIKTLQEMKGFLQAMEQIVPNDRQHNQQGYLNKFQQSKNSKYFSNTQNQRRYTDKRSKKQFSNTSVFRSHKETQQRAKTRENTYEDQKQPFFSQMNSLSSSQKVKALTDRLYNQSERKNNSNTNANCNRKQCKQIKTTYFMQEIEDLRNFTGQPLTKRHHDKIQNHIHHKSFNDSFQRSFQSSISKKQKQQLHDRLYDDARKRSLRKKVHEYKILKEQLQERKRYKTNKSKSLSQSQQIYGKNYRGFYERLDQLIETNNKRQQIYQKLNILGSSYKICQIKQRSKTVSSVQKSKSSPKPPSSKKKRVIISQKNRNSSALRKNSPCKQQLKIISEYENNQKKQELNQTSKEIVHYRETEFLQNIKSMIYDRKNKKIRVNANKIGELSQKQFQILFELIKEVEQKPEKFKSERQLQRFIRKYYENLDIAKKQELRRIQILKACRARTKKPLQLYQASSKRILQQKSVSRKSRQNTPISYKKQSQSKLLKPSLRFETKSPFSNQINQESTSRTFVGNSRHYSSTDDYCVRLSQFV